MLFGMGKLPPCRRHSVNELISPTFTCIHGSRKDRLQFGRRMRLCVRELADHLPYLRPLERVDAHHAATYDIGQYPVGCSPGCGWCPRRYAIAPDVLRGRVDIQLDTAAFDDGLCGAGNGLTSQTPRQMSALTPSLAASPCCDLRDFVQRDARDDKEGYFCRRSWLVIEQAMFGTYDDWSFCDASFVWAGKCTRAVVPFTAAFGPMSPAYAGRCQSVCALPRFRIRLHDLATVRTFVSTTS